MRTSRDHRRGGWVLKGAFLLAFMLLVNGCAPASSAQYARHLRMSHEPDRVNAKGYAAAQRVRGEPPNAVHAGAMADDADDHR